MAYNITFAGMSIEEIYRWDEERQSRLSVDLFPRRHGAIAPKLAFSGPRTVTLAGRVVKDSQADLKTYFETLSATLHNNGRHRLKKYDDGRYLNAIYRGLRISGAAGQLPDRAAEYAVEFLCDDPFWYSETPEMETATNITSSPHNLPVTLSGTVNTPCVVKITALAANKTDVKVNHTTTGVFARYAGTILTGNELSIDTANFQVLNAGANGLKDFTGAFFQLVPGLNNVQYEGPTGVTMTVQWVQRWI